MFTLLSKDPVDPKSMTEGPETVFFVSDGYVETGEIRDGYRVFEEAERWNRYRQIRFHCLGVGAQDSRFLAELAGMVPEGAYLSVP